ncbi:MAG: NADP-dependent malic enzyme [Schleiferiaceae bacterium]|nr:NADP-dependent malic enzyme [Schleiferiaceae bacterium]
MPHRKSRQEEILEYHAGKRPGKIEVVPTKPSNSQRDLSIAYSPGVAVPCQQIQENKDAAYQYTAKGNLVGVISNGTAVLGLGDIGPEASKPVMEGKGVLFKIFADIDVFDLELNATDPDAFVEAVKALEPTFGGINLEDIKAPDCFYIEKRLKEETDIPVMHDDQHGTAIIATAALLNACELVNKELKDLKVVFNGAGAAATSCLNLFVSCGVPAEQILVADSRGIIRTQREDLSPEKAPLARDTKCQTLAEAVNGADVFVGLSVGGVLSQDMVRSMAKNPIVFALANPDPEISYQDAMAARKDIIMATGRSDNPNQVNNVLGFPYIFRGALDVRARKINEEMKLAAAQAIAELAKEPVPEMVNIAYDDDSLQFGPRYIIPKPFDPRLIHKVAIAVAQAAVQSGVARQEITDWKAYREELLSRVGRDDKFIRLAQEKARQDPRSVVLAEADNLKTLKAAQVVVDDGLAKPILLGNRKRIQTLIAENNLEDIAHLPIIDAFADTDKIETYAQLFYQRRQRKGVTLFDARKRIRDRNYFGAAMVAAGDADAFVSGLTRKYSEVVKPIFEVIGTRQGIRKAAGLYIMSTNRGPLFFADTTINENPNAQEIADLTLQTAAVLERININPKVALLSYSNFGSARLPDAQKMQQALELIREQAPDLLVDGEMQANFALDKALLKETFPFSPLSERRPNVLIFPNLSASNIAYKLLQSFGAAEAIGPVLIGVNKPAHVLQLGSSVREIVNMITLASVDAQTQQPQP